MIEANLTSALTTFLEAEGKLKGTGKISLNEKGKMKIVAMTTQGKRVTRGGDVFVVELVDPQRGMEIVEVVDNLDGSYLFEFLSKMKVGDLFDLI